MGESESGEPSGDAAGPGRNLDPKDGSFAADLKALHEISMELSLAPDVDALCRRAVELGRERLCFDRIGIWFIDPDDSDWNIGSWRTDDTGNIRDERGVRVHRDLVSAPHEYYEGTVPLLVFEGEPCYDEDRRLIGRRGRAIAPLWDGRRMIGELCIDNTVSMRPLDERKREILILFARIVAHLTSLKRVEAELRLQASTDALTGVVNRRTALIILEKQLGLTWRSNVPLTVCVADLDSLKQVNDSFGHAVGDDYLKTVCASLLEKLRGSDTVGRLGGDEFIVIFPNCRREEAAVILDRVEAALIEAGKKLPYHPSLSWGLASLDDLAEGVCAEGSGLQGCMDALLDLADRRMYEVKRGRSGPRP